MRIFLWENKLSIKKRKIMTRVDKDVVKQSFLHVASWSSEEYFSTCINNNKNIMCSHAVFVYDSLCK